MKYLSKVFFGMLTAVCVIISVSVLLKDSGERAKILAIRLYWILTSWENRAGNAIRHVTFDIKYKHEQIAWSF